MKWTSTQRLVIFAGVASLWLLGAASVPAQDRGNETMPYFTGDTGDDPDADDSSTAANTSRRVVVHIHHHYMYGSPSPLTTIQQPKATWGTGWDPWAEEEGDTSALNWGKLGFFGYIGQRGTKAGLIVTRVVPKSPATQLGLVPGDFILQIGDAEVADLSVRKLDALFVSLTTKPKVKVTMVVWNSHTKRESTLNVTLENSGTGP